MRLSVLVSHKYSILRVWLAVVFLTCFQSHADAQTFELSLDESCVAARQAALAGHFGLARDGRRAGVRAFRLSQTNAERYEAARFVALAAANEDRYTLSQYWLRRAAINAPNERAFQQTQTDYRSIRSLNPWSVNLGFSVTPSSNVNGGTSSDCLFVVASTDPAVGPFCLGVFSGAAQELSGLTVTADLRLAYAVSRSAVQRTSLTAHTYARAVWLSQDARAIAPSSRNSDFGSQTFEMGVSHQRRLGDGTLSAEALSGLSWFGGDLGTNFYRASLSYGTPLSETVAITASGDIQRTNLKGIDPHSNFRTSAALELSYITEGHNRIRGQLSYDVQDSDSVNERFETLTAQFGYSWSDPIGPLQLSMVAGVSYSDFHDYTLPFPPLHDGRQDTRIFGSITASLPAINYAGFVPVMTLGFQDTHSNVSRFERDEYSVNIGVRSSF